MLSGQNEITISEEQRSRTIGDLQLFKMLLQPHFLFNSLNNIYALSVKRSDQTSEAIAGLSQLLEQVVTSSRREYINLGEEIHLIKEYIKLERIWLGELNMVVDIQVSGDTDTLEIPPLVLYTFVENCFKHGIRKCNGQGWLKIKIKESDGNLVFSTRNNLPAWQQDAVEHGQDRSGFGTVAAKEMLDKRCAGRYSLSTNIKRNIYELDLTIKKMKLS